ncbi:aspartate kinase [Antarcticibacterium sp. 1MA-6-2]|uniref:aspartate kinase n=1 Tax=Antarcticibacterium sp. 1MA-6-2 TaxID=2908210 RepID=UPI002883336A|nr:aspartate kinase [Antarcticibacterium sp. 1MA-6-2]
MKVLKFGGTSVGSAESIQNVRTIVSRIEGPKLIVLSAMSGVTNILVRINENLKVGEITEAEELISELRKKHLDLVDSLIPTDNATVINHVNSLFQKFLEILQEENSENAEARIVTFGESVLTYIVSAYFSSKGMDNLLLEAKKFMHVPNLENPDTEKVGGLLGHYLKDKIESDIYITQGFVRTDKFNRINTLKRGGSDYTATILGAAIRAEEIQIWTDIDGFHNNDPRYVEDTHSLSHLSFEEAAELAYFGAKILHPQTVSPVIDKNIPIYLKNTFTPDLPGTKISNELSHTRFKSDFSER